MSLSRYSTVSNSWVPTRCKPARLFSKISSKAWGIPTKMGSANSVAKVISLMHQLKQKIRGRSWISKDKPVHFRWQKETTPDQQEAEDVQDSKLVAHPVLQVHRLETQNCSLHPSGLTAILPGCIRQTLQVGETSERSTLRRKLWTQNPKICSEYRIRIFCREQYQGVLGILKGKKSSKTSSRPQHRSNEKSQTGSASPLRQSF